MLAAPTDGGLSSLVERHGHAFAAVVSRSLGLRAELDILMLRPSTPGDIVHRRDIDNRLKTLLDALSAPAQPKQIPDGLRPTSDEDPMYVLLEDDSLITRLNVETERLLAASSLDGVRLTIRVTTRIVKPMFDIAATWTTTPTATVSSDVYSIAASTYWMLAGEPPHDLSACVTKADVIAYISSSPARRLRDVAPHVPDTIARVIDRALAMNTADRPESPTSSAPLSAAA